MNVRLSALVLAAGGLVFVTPARADNAADGARVEGLLKQSGYVYERKSDTAFVVPQHRTNLGDYKVIVAVGDGLVVIFVTFARKNQITMTPELADKMLRMNHKYDMIKVGIDDDGDADVREDTSLRLLDEAELKAAIHQVAASTDEIYGALKSDLN